MLYKSLISFAKDEQGAVAVEYMLLAAVMAVPLIPVVTGYSTEVNGLFNRATAALSELNSLELPK